MPLPDKTLPFRQWYDILQKPAWTPSVSIIGLIWSILYPIITLVYGFAIIKIIKGVWPKTLLIPIIINIILNLSFTPIQFGVRNFVLASVVVVGVAVTAIWSLIAIYPHNKGVALALIPYCLWTVTASILQIQITWLNR